MEHPKDYRFILLPCPISPPFFLHTFLVDQHVANEATQSLKKLKGYIKHIQKPDSHLSTTIPNWQWTEKKLSKRTFFFKWTVFPPLILYDSAIIRTPAHLIIQMKKKKKKNRYQKIRRGSIRGFLYLKRSAKYLKVEATQRSSLLCPKHLFTPTRHWSGDHYVVNFTAHHAYIPIIPKQHL